MYVNLNSRHTPNIIWKLGELFDIRVVRYEMNKMENFVLFKIFLLVSNLYLNISLTSGDWTVILNYIEIEWFYLITASANS